MQPAFNGREGDVLFVLNIPNEQLGELLSVESMQLVSLLKTASQSTAPQSLNEHKA